MRHYLLLFLKGMGMGAADVVPGVSGGTIAFVSGIYQELIDSIGKINLHAIKLLFSQGPAAAWRYINANFLLAVFAGVFTSILSLAQLVSYLLEAHPILVWSFFFGLVLASALYFIRQLDRWHIAEGSALLAGVIIAVVIATVRPAELPGHWWMLLLAGSVSICAMILPGISGSFILVLFGLYTTVLTAVKNFELVLIVSFLTGCIAGLLAFSRLLSWLLQHYYRTTLSLLTGFLFGSLYLIWPWKQVVSTRTNSNGEQVPLLQVNLWPNQYAESVGEPQLIFAVAALIFGIVLVFGLEFFADKSQKKI